MGSKQQDRINEYFCKIILEDELKMGLYQICDKPDLQNINDGIGVEVTGTEENKSTGLTKQYLSETNNQKKLKIRKKLEETGAIIVDKYDSVILLKILTPKFALTLINEKLEKLQKYKIFNKNCLIITTSLFVPKIEDLQILFRKIEDNQKLYNIKFDEIYFVDLNYIYIFDFKNDEIKVKQFTSYNDYLTKAKKKIKEKINE